MNKDQTDLPDEAESTDGEVFIPSPPRKRIRRAKSDELPEAEPLGG